MECDIEVASYFSQSQAAVPEGWYVSQFDPRLSINRSARAGELSSSIRRYTELTISSTQFRGLFKGVVSRHHDQKGLNNILMMFRLADFANGEFGCTF